MTNGTRQLEPPWEPAISSTPATTTAKAMPRIANRAAEKPSSSPNSNAPQANATTMLRGVQVPAARASPIVCDALSTQ